MTEKLTIIAQRQRPRAIADIAVAAGLSFALAFTLGWFSFISG